MRILFLTKYGPKAASCRHRFMQFFPALREHGFECYHSPFFEDSYLEHKFRTGNGLMQHVAAAYWRRLRELFALRRFDLLVVQYELMPFIPLAFESRAIFGGRPYICDFDDAIFHNYDLHPSKIVRRLLGKKIGRVMAGAAHVIVGSKYLADYARDWTSHITVAPTSVDLRVYAAMKEPRVDNSELVIGWMGSPSTARYVDLVGDALREVARSANVRLVMVGGGEVNIPGVRLECKEWSSATEVQDLLGFDVGIMPLDDAPWSRGKCGFKLIQYMACGLPVIASPIGANNDLVREGDNGFLAGTTGEWVDALQRLYRNIELRQKMGLAGRQRVVQEYSAQVVTPRIISVFESLRRTPS